MLSWLNSVQRVFIKIQRNENREMKINNSQGSVAVKSLFAFLAVLILSIAFYVGMVKGLGNTKTELEKEHKEAIASIDGIALCLKSYEKAVEAIQQVDNLKLKQHLEKLRREAEFSIISPDDEVPNFKAVAIENPLDRKTLKSSFDSCVEKAKKLTNEEG